MVLLKSSAFFKDLMLQEVYGTFHEINKSNLFIFANSSLFRQDFETEQRQRYFTLMVCTDDVNTANDDNAPSMTVLLNHASDE